MTLGAMASLAPCPPAAAQARAEDHGRPRPPSTDRRDDMRRDDMPARADRPADAPAADFHALEARGARIGHIEIRAGGIFDLDDPREDHALFRLANRLHPTTRAEVIERDLLFRSGEPVSAARIDETERLLRSRRYIQDVRIRPLAVRGDVVDVEVRTRDTWTLDPQVSIGRAGGVNTSSVTLREYNLLGTGLWAGIGRSNDIDRRSTFVQVGGDRVGGTDLAFAASHAANDDGHRTVLSIARPFRSLDDRRAAALAVVDDERIDTAWRAGEVVDRWRRADRRIDAEVGVSGGRVDGWTLRTSLGLMAIDERYAPVGGTPGTSTPPTTLALPPDEQLVGPYVRWQWIEDRFEWQENRDLMGRPESFALGLRASLRLGWASRALGSDADTLLYAADVARGFAPVDGSAQRVAASAWVSGRVSPRDGLPRRQRLGGALRWYVPNRLTGPDSLFFVGASADMLTRPEAVDVLYAGGDEGLRGHPLRWQAGTRRVLLSVEQRRYTGLYLGRVFRVGAAAFVDVGRAWGGPWTNPVQPGWLADAGVGLRFVNTRAAFSNVVHVDVAAPLRAVPGERRVQLVVKARATF